MFVAAASLCIPFLGLRCCVQCKFMFVLILTDTIVSLCMQGISGSGATQAHGTKREKMYKASCDAVEKFCQSIGQPPVEALDALMGIIQAIHKEV